MKARLFAAGLCLLLRHDIVMAILSWRRRISRRSPNRRLLGTVAAQWLLFLVNPIDYSLLGDIP
jgi:hypothetical protein